MVLTVFEFVVLALSVHRFTHLVVEDQFPLVRIPRDWIVDRKPEGPIAYLVNCFWCTSVWIAAFHVGLIYLIRDGLEAPVFVGAALSTVAVFVETIVEYLDARMIGGGG